MALYVFSSHKKGISSHQLAKDRSVTQKRAWFLLHRLRYAIDHLNFTKVVGNVVEIDECGIGGQSYYKHANKKTKNPEGATISNKDSVIGLRERDGNVKVPSSEFDKNLLVLLGTPPPPKKDAKK